jgi:hypothetical protein
VNKFFVVLAGACLLGGGIQAQSPNMGQISGNFQIDSRYLFPDTLINAPNVPEKSVLNGWGQLNYVNGKFSAGVRYEAFMNPTPDIDPRYKGQGFPYRFASYKGEQLEIRLGNCYDQFGSGLIFRAYEDRGLVWDNSIDGFQARFTPRKGIYLKGIWGKQRAFWTQSAGIVRGFDGEININEALDSLTKNWDARIILGGSFVSRYQIDQDPTYELPVNVGTWAARANIMWKRFSLYAEYGYKINDPQDGFKINNKYVYKPGQALYLSATYSQKGLGVILSAKHIDNFSFRSDRTATGTAMFINYLPALTKQHTYILAAYYPYATQANGEVGAQAEVTYKIKKGTKLGGKYGTNVQFNYSVAHALDTTSLNDTVRLMGYTTKMGRWGDSLFFQDINIEINRKINQKLKLNLVYTFLRYNKNVIEGKANYPIIDAHTAVVDVIWKINDKFTLRSDAEHMFVTTSDDNYFTHNTHGNVVDFGHWVALTEELTIGEHWYVAVMDQYNYGNYESIRRIHYINGQVGYMRNTTRIVVGYGKQRAGIFCVGGVCRFVPASNGFTLSITSAF